MKTVEEDAREALLELRGTLGQVLAAAAPNAERACEIQAALKIDKKLAWRVHHFLNEPDVMAASLYLPSASGLEQVLKGARSHGSDKVAAGEQRTREAFENYMGVVSSHAVERTVMDMMMASSSPTAQAEASRTHQRNAYKANSYIWGAQAKLQLSSIILNPSETSPGRVDIAMLRGLAQLRRIRPNVPWVFARALCIDDDGEIRYPLDLHPIDPQPTREDGLPPVSLLRSFCSKPVPEVRRVLGSDRHILDEIVEGPVGNSGLLDCFTGEVAKGAGVTHSGDHNKVADFAVRVRTPVQWLLLDVFAAGSSIPVDLPWVRSYSDIAGLEYSPGRSERDRLPLNCEVQSLGRGIAGAYLPQLKKYPAMLEHAFTQLGWESSNFHHFRVLVEFPVMPSSIHMGWNLAEAPSP